MNITITNIEKKLKNQSVVSKCKDAAVLIPIVRDSKQQLHLLFQVRSKNLNWQPGDICFPGGKIEPVDASPIDAAIRETSEELGIKQKQINIHGQLPDFWAVLGFRVYPIVGEIDSLDELNINRQEVERIFTVPISWFIDNPPIAGEINMVEQVAEGFPLHLLSQKDIWPIHQQRTLYFYQYDEYVIWGLTAYIIQLFLQTIKD